MSKPVAGALLKVAGHTVEKHLGKSFAYLMSRNIPVATSFFSNTMAHLLVKKMIKSSEAEIAAWLGSSSNGLLKLTLDTKYITGYGVEKAGANAFKKIAQRGVKAFFKKDGAGGYVLWTAYPGG